MVDWRIVFGISAKISTAAAMQIARPKVLRQNIHVALRRAIPFVSRLETPRTKAASRIRDDAIPSPECHFVPAANKPGVAPRFVHLNSRRHFPPQVCHKLKKTRSATSNLRDAATLVLIRGEALAGDAHISAAMIGCACVPLKSGTTALREIPASRRLKDLSDERVSLE
jgi:hypothetical protein